MAQPKGYEGGPPGSVCRLKKSLYGLKQAPRAWYSKLKQELERLGFTASQADPTLYIAEVQGSTVWVLVYVDDIQIAGSNSDAIRWVKSQLMSTFDVRDLGPSRYFLGMQLIRDRAQRTLKVVQSRMVKELLDKFGLADCNSRVTPLSVGANLAKGAEDELLDTSRYSYSELVGSLLYLATCSRPDIQYAAGALARHLAAPARQHWEAAKGVLRYLAGTVDVGLVYGGGPAELVGYCNADFAGDLDRRRRSRLQPTVWRCPRWRRSIWQQHRLCGKGCGSGSCSRTLGNRLGRSEFGVITKAH